MNIKIITEKAAIEIIDTREPLGLFIVHYAERNVYTGMDNSVGEAFVGEFKTIEECIAWLREEEYCGNINEVEIYKKALEKWGHDLQKVVAIEEMSELTKELSKNMRGKNNRIEIAEEIADVEIMLAQMKILFSIQEGVKKHKQYKIKRLEEKLKL